MCWSCSCLLSSQWCLTMPFALKATTFEEPLVMATVFSYYTIPLSCVIICCMTVVTLNMSSKEELSTAEPGLADLWNIVVDTCWITGGSICIPSTAAGCSCWDDRLLLHTHSCCKGFSRGDILQWKQPYCHTSVGKLLVFPPTHLLCVTCSLCSYQGVALLPPLVCSYSKSVWNLPISPIKVIPGRDDNFNTRSDEGIVYS